MQEFDYIAKGEMLDYSREAALFSFGLRNSRHQPLGYNRFERAADAIRFAIEALSLQLLTGTCLEVDEVRVDGTQIRRLYHSADYLIARAADGPLR